MEAKAVQVQRGVGGGGAVPVSSQDTGCPPSSGITAHGLPLEWLVIDTTPRHESSDHPLEELFQFSDYCGPSKLGVLPLRKPSQPPRMPIDTVDAQPGGTHKFHWNRHSALLKLYHILLGNWKYCNSIGAVSAKNRGEHPNKPLTHHRVSNQ